MQLGDADPRLDPQRRVEIGERLVEQIDLGRAHDGPANGDALALAARQLSRLAVEIGRQLQHPRHFLGPRPPLGLGHAREPQAHGHVVGDGHVRIKGVGLEDHGHAALGRRHVGETPVAEIDVAFRAVLEAGDHPKKRRFPAAGRADEYDELAVRDGQVDAAQRLEASEQALRTPSSRICTIVSPSAAPIGALQLVYLFAKCRACQSRLWRRLVSAGKRARSGAGRAAA